MGRRRDFLKGLGFGGAGLTLGSLSSVSCTPAPTESNREAEALLQEIISFPIDDTHTHPITDKDAQTTPERFLERLSLVGFGLGNYFPQGVYRQWVDGDSSIRAELDREYDISATVSEVTYHVGESVFTKYMIKEMAQFLGCAPNLNEVIEARNERGQNYWQYVNTLFQDVKLENIMLDTGFSEGLDAAGIDQFENAIKPTNSRRIYRVETIQRELLQQDLSFEDLESQFVAMVRRGLDQDGNYGKKSYGMKSYLMPRIGVVKPLYDSGIAKRSWDEYRSTRTKEYSDREEVSHRGEELLRYLLTLAMEECLERDMPMQFHAGDGEAPGIILRQQDPYNLEEMVRFDKPGQSVNRGRDGMMTRPKIIPIHAGYPLVGKLAWLCHLYTNCYFDLSIMTPFAHQGLLHRYLQVMEAVPLSKILYSSDPFHVPELYWLAGRWGKRFLSQALAVYVQGQVLSREEALEAARMILFKNNRRVYNLSS